MTICIWIYAGRCIYTLVDACLYPYIGLAFFPSQLVLVRAQMELVILRVSSPDLQPEVGGMPNDPQHFAVEVEVMLAPVGREGDDITFSFSAISRSALMQKPTNAFVSNTLVLAEFSWVEVRRHIERLLMQAHSCATWECVAFRLAGYMRPLGATFNAL